MLDDAAEFQAAVGTGRDLRGDQEATETGDVGGDGFRVGIGYERDVLVCHGELLSRSDEVAALRLWAGRRPLILHRPRNRKHHAARIA
ncbi:hypothetical protein D3C87_1277990 [compost metagenome]